MSEREKSNSKTKMIRTIVLIVLVLIVGGVVFYMSPFMDTIREEVEKQKERNELMDTGFLSLPEILINLKSSDGKNSILKATFVLSLSTEQDSADIERLKPLIMDQFQTYLREQEVENLDGAAGLERVRQELLQRVNIVVAPIEVKRVLVKDFLLQ